LFPNLPILCPLGIPIASTILRFLKDESLTSMLIRGSSASLSIKMLGTGIIFGVQVLLARWLGVNDYGTYIYALTWMNYLILFGRLGFDMATLRFVSGYEGKNSWGLLRGYIKRTNQISLLFASFVSLLTIFVACYFRKRFDAELYNTFFIACFLVPTTSLLLINESTLKALKRVALGQLPNQVFRPLLLTIYFLFATLVLGINPNSSLAMLANCTATFCSLMIVILFVKKSVPLKIYSEEIKFDTRHWISVSLPMLMITTFNMVLAKTDVIMIGILRNHADVGIYNAAKQLATLMLFGLVAANAIIGPMISMLYAQGRLKDLQNIVRLAARGITMFTLPIWLLYFLKGDFVLSLFGTAFTKGHFALAILASGQLVNAFAGPAALILTMTGNHSIVTKIFGLSALMNILLNFILIKKIGILGAALSTALITVIWNVIVSYVSLKRLGLKATAI
jgi:O-antigen/teichoic acid export membrane protein